ncbi:hypothetical protein TSMEX_008835 [Taenia solium]|eukprot:TsM_000646200 transcript=TsM_000646200 gene=TsM_000646200
MRPCQIDPPIERVQRLRRGSYNNANIACSSKWISLKMNSGLLVIFAQYTGEIESVRIAKGRSANVN